MAIQQSIKSNENLQKLFNFEEKPGVENIFPIKNKTSKAEIPLNTATESQEEDAASERKDRADIHKALVDFKFNWQSFMGDVRNKIRDEDGLNFLNNNVEVFRLNETSEIALIDELDKLLFQAECLAITFRGEDFPSWSKRIQHGALWALGDLVEKSNVIKQKLRNFEKESSAVKVDQCKTTITTTTEKNVSENNSEPAAQNSLKNHSGALGQICDNAWDDFTCAYDNLTLITEKAKDLSTLGSDENLNVPENVLTTCRYILDEHIEQIQKDERELFKRFDNFRNAVLKEINS